MIPKEIYYNRNGYLAQETSLNPKIARGFMEVSDIRRNIMIVDSPKPFPEHKRLFEPIKFRSLEIIGNQYRLMIHDRMLDTDIRRRLGSKNEEKHDAMYLSRLRKEINGGLGDILTGEKLGWKEQRNNYLMYGGCIFISAMAHMPKDSFETAALKGVVLLFMSHATLSAVSHYCIEPEYDYYGAELPPSVNPRTKKTGLLPPIPIDRYVRGKYFLVRHSNQVVITTTK